MLGAIRRAARVLGATLIKSGFWLRERAGVQEEVDEGEEAAPDLGLELSPEARRMIEEGRLPGPDRPAKAPEPLLEGSAAYRAMKRRGGAQW